MFIGVDVGSGSVRACLMDKAGMIKHLSSREIHRWEPVPNHVNQSSSEIWDCVCKCVRDIVSDSGIASEDVLGIAFDATCSLVVTDKEGLPLAAGPDFENREQDIMMWMDHRADNEVAIIRDRIGSDPILDYLGGEFDIEMEIPRILWLKHQIHCDKFENYNFYDLPDWLSFKCTGNSARSFCSVSGKQGYTPGRGWSDSLFNKIGLESIASSDYRQLAGPLGKLEPILAAGQPVGKLSENAAKELKLTTSTIVGSSVVDSYAGWIGSVGARSRTRRSDVRLGDRVAMISGTSTCYILQSDEFYACQGIWGTIKSAVLPGKWYTECGQSATGELLRHIVASHPASRELSELAMIRKLSLYETLNELLYEMQARSHAPSVYHLAQDLFWYGDLHGNRSPLGDHTMRGSVVGLRLNSSLEDLALHYLAAMESIALQMRQIIHHMTRPDRNIEAVYMSGGGQCNNKILTTLMATSIKRPIVISRNKETSVIFGAALLAASAAMPENSLIYLMSQYSEESKRIEPLADGPVQALLDAKYEVYLDQIACQRRYRNIVDKALRTS